MNGGGVKVFDQFNNSSDASVSYKGSVVWFAVTGGFPEDRHQLFLY